MDKETLSAIKQLLKEELSPIKPQLDGLQSQTSENTQSLKALEYRVDIIKTSRKIF
ncbi:hypothetical protein ACJDU8_22610 [Clostridium sp. WILCCON 0269]|uniref:Uncharacterized protein n=1 Tax=Candidatus Clostridium eludens TaxID=3381663 RepID=A0ABW8SRG3_9CLOT